MSTELSVVVPMYDEEDVLPLLVDRLRPLLDALGASYEVLAVDDGSRDATPVLLQRYRQHWPQLRVLRLRANAGHQAAISAGLAHARGDFVATLDADLQDPPEVIAEMLAVARRDGVDVVYGIRADRSTDSAFKRGSARAFYRLIRQVSGTTAPADAGDFRLMSRATVEAVNGLPEHHRVLRFVVPALGFPSGEVHYRREVRAAGSSKYPLARMIRLSVDSLTGFSTAPLRLATWFGLGGGLAAFGLLVYALVAQLQRPHGRRLDLDRGRGGGRRRRAAAVPGPARRVHRPDVHADAGPAVVLRGLRLAAGQPGRRAVTRSVTPGSRRTGR